MLPREIVKDIMYYYNVAMRDETILRGQVLPDLLHWTSGITHILEIADEPFFSFNPFQLTIKNGHKNTGRVWRIDAVE